MKILLTALCCFSVVICLSQQNRDSLYFKKLEGKSITQNYEKNISADIPFKNIKVIDARPDTSSVGFFRLNFLGSMNKLIFENGLPDEILNFAKSKYRLSSKDSAKDLLIIIKEYRVSRYAKEMDTRGINTLNWMRGIIVDAELFMQDKNSYHALYKVDSIVTDDSIYSLNQLIQRSFSILFDKISNKDFSKLHVGKTEFTYDDIEKHIGSFYNFPILKDSVLKKGVYKNFNEFILNTPSITNYEIHKGKLSDELYVTENNQSYPLQDYWGYCDGKNLFIRSEKNLFQLNKIGSTFNVRGIKSFWVVTTKQGTNAYTNYDVNLAPFQLNMQNGELY